MAAPDLLAGNRLRVYRSAGGTPEAFNFICIAQSKTLTFTNEFEDATVPDCDTPTSIPSRKSVMKSNSAGGRIAGIVDAKRFQVIYGDSQLETPTNYQFLIDKPAADGGGAWTFPVYFETLEISSQNNGLVNFTAQIRSDGKPVWTPATA